jgi:hypothetical protein
MFLFVQKIISSTAATRKGMFTGYAILGAVCYGATFLLWHWLGMVIFSSYTKSCSLLTMCVVSNVPIEPTFHLLTSAMSRKASAAVPVQHATEHDVDDDTHRRATQYVAATKNGGAKARLALSDGNSSNGNDSPPLGQAQAQGSNDSKSTGDNTSNPADIYQSGMSLPTPRRKPLMRPVNQSRMKLSDRSIFAQFWSFPCLFGIIFAIVHVNRANIYLGTIHSQLKYIVLILFTFACVNKLNH